MAISFNKKMLVEAVKQILAEHETDPNLELTVGDYQTKHYHICPGAKTLYQDIENKVEDMDLAVRAAKLQDALFAMEEMALERGATEADVFAAEAVASQIMSMAEMMGLSQEHSYIQGHVDKIKAAADGMEEAKAYDVETPTSKRTMSFANDQEANDFAKKNINVTRATPVRETHSVGHIDDEPGMLKQFAFDTAEYAVKLYKLLHHYEQMEDQVDFPNWWQHKVMMAREYMSKATHYLEFETMKPQIDAAVDATEPELTDDQLQELFNRVKDKTINYKGHIYRIIDVDKAGTFTLIDPEDPSAEAFYVNQAQMKQGEVKPVEYDTEEMELDIHPDLDEARKRGQGTVQKELDDVKAKMKELAKKYSSGDKSVVATLKDLTAKKKELEKELNHVVSKIGAGQEYKGEVDEAITEGVSCCGRCGRVHESAQDCKKPYISKDSPKHCKNKK